MNNEKAKNLNLQYLSRGKEYFEPLSSIGRNVCCGPTVYSDVHLRAAVHSSRLI